MEIRATVLVAGHAKGIALVAKTPLSLWGGLDPHTGMIIDRRHELAGENASGKVLVIPTGKGSSTASAILLECIRAGTGPAAIITSRFDPIIALGSIVGDELYGRSIPILVFETAPSDINTGDVVTIGRDGVVTIDGR